MSRGNGYQLHSGNNNGYRRELFAFLASCKILVMSMTGKKTRTSWGRTIFSGGHLFLFALIAFDSASTPGGTWYRLIPIDPFCGIFLWVVTSYFGVFALFAILGTAQWFLIGLLLDICIETIRKRLRSS
jgi:hypothetical protein